VKTYRDLADRGFRRGTIVRKMAATGNQGNKIRGVALRLELIYDDGVVIARSMTVGQVRTLNADQLLADYVLDI
jgi:hypothetical protein